jgi:hypothetical protein
LIIGSLTPSVIGDRPSHPIYRDFSKIDKLGRPLDNFPLADDPLRERYRTALAKI